MPERTLVIIGGGIAGLAAAWEATGGPGRVGGADVRVIVVEAADRIGGKLDSAEFGGRVVDVGPDGFLGRRPEAAALCRELGVPLVPIGASGAAVYARGRRRNLPEGLALGIPTKLIPTARSGILSFGGTLRLARDVIAPKPDRRAPLGDRAIGPLVARKLGHQVVDRLVDPLLGGINAGGVSDASAAAMYPLLLAVAQRRGSFMHAMRRAVTLPDPEARAKAKAAKAAAKAARKAARQGSDADADTGTGTTGPTPSSPPATGDANPAFWAVPGGLATLADVLGAALDDRGVQIRTGCLAKALREVPGGWEVETSSGAIRADGVILAVPGGPTADLLEPLDADAAAVVRAVEYAPVALVTLRYTLPEEPDQLEGTGLLVPHGTMHGDEPFLVTACSYLDRKWPHLRRPGEFLVRASVGRYADVRHQELDDDALVARVTEELAVLLDLEAAPTEALVTRWPEALPQYRVHHLLRVSAIEAAVGRLGKVAVAGALYRGVGIPACIASGRQAARTLLDT